MTLQLAVKITGDASSLKQAALEGTAATKGLGAAAQAAGGQASAAAAGISRVTAATEAAAKAQRDHSAAMAAGVMASADIRKAMGLAVEAQSAAAIASGRASSGTASAAQATSGFRPDQWKNLGFQANDIATSLASGSSPMQVLAQQGGQVAQVLGDAPGGVAGGLKIVAGRAMEILTPVRLVAGGFAGLAAGVAYLGVTWSRSQDEIKTGLLGIGAQSRATVSDINRIAETAAGGGKIGRSDARGIATAVAATGKVDVSNVPDIVDLAPGYSKLFGKDLKDAGTDLARIFADPVKGAAELDARMGGLDASTQAYIRTLTEQNNRQEAVRVIVRTFGAEIRAAADNTSAWGSAWGVVSGAAEAAGRAIAKPFTAGTTKEQLAAARAELARAQSAASTGLVIGGGPDLAQDRARRNIAARQAEVDRLEKRDLRETAAPARLASAELSKEAEATVRALQPEIDQLEKLNSSILLLQKTQGDADAMAGLSARSRNQITTALEAARGGVETFMSAQDKARASEALTIRSIEARTDAERAAIAAERERLNLSGQNVGLNDQRKAAEAARQAVLAQSNRESQDRLRGAIASNAAAGLLSYPRQIAENDAKYRDIIFADPTNASNLQAKALDRQAIDKEAIGGPLRDANRALAEQSAALKIQEASFGASAEAAAKMAATQQLINQYSAAGVPITDNLRRLIDTYATSLAEVAGRQEAFYRRQRDIVGGLDDLRSGTRSGLTGIFSDVSQSRSPLAGITSSLNGMASRVFDRTVSAPLTESVFGQEGKTGGGMLGDLLGGVFGGGKQAVSTAQISATVVNLSGPVTGLGSVAAWAANGNANIPSAATVAAGLGGASGAGGNLLGAGGRLDPQAAFGYLRSNGMNDAQAAAVLGNIRQESGFNPSSFNAKEDAFGLYQLRLDRQSGLRDFASSQGTAASDPKTQLDFMMREMRTTEARNSTSFLGATDLAGANAGLKKFIRYGDDSQGNRLSYGEDYLRQFGGRPAGTPSAADVAAPLATLDTSLKSVSTTATAASQGVGQLTSSLGSGGGGLLGILANLFGGSAGGASAATATVAAAGGGHIRGPGTGTSDSIAAWLSDGEFVVNAAATKRSLPMLQAINENRMPAFAQGGPVGGGAATTGAWASDQGTALAVNIIGAPSTPKVRQSQDGPPRRSFDVVFDEATAAAYSRPGSKTAAAMGRPPVAVR